MKNISILIALLLCSGFSKASAQSPGDTICLTLQEAITLAQLQSVDAAVTINALKRAYWVYKTHHADQLPEVNFTGYIPSYYKTYSKYLSDEGYRFSKNHSLGMSGQISIDQNIPLTGGKISLNTSLDFNRTLGEKAVSEYVSIPVGVTLRQPLFTVNTQKWDRKIEPVRYKEAKANYMEQVEVITLNTISYFFYLLSAKVSLNTALQNLENAEKLYELALAKREIGYISENELLQLEITALQARGTLTDAQSNVNYYMFNLRSFLGLSEQDIIEPVIPESAPLLELMYHQVQEKANENNALAQTLLRMQLEADYELATAKGKRREIELVASIGYTGRDKFLLDSYRNLMSNQVVEVGIKIPILDWGRRKGNVKVAQSNRDVILSEIRQREMDFNQKVFLLVENFNNQAAQLNIAAAADKIAEERYNTTLQTFMIGQINILDLNDARNSRDNARTKHIEELRRYWYYYYNVRSLTLYDFLNDRPIDSDIEELIRQ